MTLVERDGVIIAILGRDGGWLWLCGAADLLLLSLGMVEVPAAVIALVVLAAPLACGGMRKRPPTSSVDEYSPPPPP